MQNSKKALYNLHVMGEITAPKVLLVHGAGFYWETCFAPMIQRLSDTCCLILPELEGHGEHSTEDMTSVAETAAEIAAAMAERGIDSVDVAYGISLGASIVCEMGLQHHVSIREMILDSGQYITTGDMTDQYANFMADAFMGLKDGVHLVSPVKESMGYANGQDVEALQPLIWKPITRETLYHTFLAVYQYDITKREERIEGTVTIMYGTNEAYAPSSTPVVAAICKTEPTTVTVADCGHAQALSEKPDEIIREIQKRL